MAKSNSGRGSARGSGKDGGKAGWPAKTGNLSGKGRDNSPASGKSKGK